MQEPIHNHHIQYPSKLEQRITFFFVCMGIIAITYGVLYVFDFLPEKPGETNTETVEEEVTKNEVTKEVNAPLPIKISFDSLDREAVVLNAELDTIEALDAALLEGVVRHPDSADFKNTGTIFLLGHSSYLPNVKNKNFQAFNGIQKLKWGDTIRLESNDTEYVYSVDRVYEAKASDASVPLQYETAKLVLATCNSFGSKDDRYIVEASLIRTTPLSEKDGK